ncbi:hypothetical protein [Kribbella solani]|uniref:Uncharacterized protein n=1 Tax=Kribbella solani TaxID=236067 RepID=A0A841DUZ8_9ACTN|nr:hypothetical protein [Kribbella solani]MBB5982423.1 hypothetical protein [Kribbella solani]
MSFVESRAAIAEALSTVEGVTGYPKRPTTWTPGDAIVLVEQIDHTLGVAWQVTWRIVLLLSGDEGVAIEQLDELLPLITDALQPLVYVDTATPEAVQTEGGDMTAVVILARSE